MQAWSKDNNNNFTPVMTDLKRYFISEDEINKVIAGENIPLTAVTLRLGWGKNVPNSFFWQANNTNLDIF